MNQNKNTTLETGQKARRFPYTHMYRGERLAVSWVFRKRNRKPKRFLVGESWKRVWKQVGNEAENKKGEKQGLLFPTYLVIVSALPLVPESVDSFKASHAAKCLAHSVWRSASTASGNTSSQTTIAADAAVNSFPIDCTALVTTSVSESPLGESAITVHHPETENVLR